MKIHNNATGNDFLISTEMPINILVSEYQDEIVQSLTQFFGAKKKNKCIVSDERRENINCDEFEFIYVPYLSSIENNFEFKPKSMFNIEMTNFILENPRMFLSYDRMRENFLDSLTDEGMYKLEKIINSDIYQKVHIDIGDFNLSNIVQMLEISTEDMSESQKYEIVYNLLLYINRENNSIIYIDFPMDDLAIQWLIKKDNKQNIFIINNECLQSNHLTNLTPLSFQIVSNKDFKQEFNLDYTFINNISYIFHPYVIRNLDQQTEKNNNLYKQFSDVDTTFHLYFNETNSINNR